jgi:large subunit ribosomal protein L4
MQLELLNDQGQATSKVDAPDTVFARDYNEALVHQVVVGVNAQSPPGTPAPRHPAFQANARQGTRAQLDRAEVKHSTKKPWRQKGTGRARAGMTSSPLWRGGGRIFPNSPDENFTQKVNKKMYRAGMAAIFSQLAREGRLAVVDAISVDAPKTKLLAAKFKAMGLDSVLVITDQLDDNLLMASRNLANVLVVEPRYADPLSLVHFKKVLVTKAAMEQLKEMLG